MMIEGQVANEPTLIRQETEEGREGWMEGGKEGRRIAPRRTP